MEDKVYKMAMELLSNEAYDMQEAFSNNEIAETVMNIVERLNENRNDDIEVDLKGNQIKVRNVQHWSFVSFSTDECTGLSESVAEIVDLSKPIDNEEVTKIIEMMNEAWYASVS